jgi:purine-nucleoside phosphorylase
VGLFEDLHYTANAIRTRAGKVAPKIGVILGSGLGEFADSFEEKVVLPYGDLPNFPRVSVPGHAGRLVLGWIGGEPAVAMQGRIHYYEGFSPSQVAFPARVLCALGIEALTVTNASGTLNPSFAPGELMAIVDHINAAAWSPLVGPNDDRLGPRFPDMTAAYDPALIELLLQAGARAGVSLRKGVYAMLRGPSYETPAEIRALRVLGADAVGMSTVPEVIVARHMGVKVAGLSCITNLAAGIGPRPLTHEEVAATANRSRDIFCSVLRGFLPAAARL